MKLTDKIKNFLKPKKSEEKQSQTTKSEPAPVSPKQSKAEIHEPHDPKLPESFLARFADKEKDRTVKIPYDIDENEIYHPTEETEETVVVPEGVTYIPKKAFKGKAVRSVQLPESLIWIEAEAFSGTALEEIVLPASLQFLQKETFAECKYLKKVVMPAGLLGIGEGVFKNCNALTSADIPESVRYLDESCFSSSDISSSLKKSFEPTVHRLNCAVQQTVCSVPKSAKEKLYFSEFLFRYRKATELLKKFPEQLKAYYFLELGDTAEIYRNMNGRKIFSVLEHLPIFDSGDARYGSYRKLYLFRSPDGNGFSGIEIYGGYEIASVTLYENVFPADGKTKYLLDILEL